MNTGAPDIRIKAKVCLLRPPTVNNVNEAGKDATPPMSIAYLASALKLAGNDVQVIDAIGGAIHQYTRKDIGNCTVLLHGLTTDQILSQIDEDVSIIGVAIMFSAAWLNTKELVTAIKNRFPNKKIVVGGEHATSCHDFILNSCPAIDVCVLGEGEDTLVDLVHAYTKYGSFERVTGIAFKLNNKMVSKPERPRIKDVDSISRPAWDLVPIEEYIDNNFTHGINIGRTMPIIASRGCPYRCTFCSNRQMWSSRWRVRKAKYVVSEMKSYIRKYNVSNFDFYDMSPIIQKKWIIEFCQLLVKENLNITWQLPTGTRCEAIDKDVSIWMYKSGCRALNFAPETGSPGEIIRIKKCLNLDELLKSARVSVEAGIQVKCNFINGMPGQTWKEVLETFFFITKLAFSGVPDISCFPFCPYPGSEMFNKLFSAGEIQLNEEYFIDLILRNNPEKAVSYNKNINSLLLSILSPLAMAYFYTLSFLLSPSRFIRIIRQIINRDNTNSKLLTALSHRHRKKMALKLSIKRNEETVILEKRIRSSK